MDAPSISAAELTRAIHYRQQERAVLAKQIQGFAESTAPSRKLSDEAREALTKQQVASAKRVDELDAEIKALTAQLPAKDNPPK